MAHNMTGKDPYFLPAGYKKNASNITLDAGDSFYWDPARIRRSQMHQFAVYEWAARLIAQKNIRVVADVGCGFAAKLAWLHGRFPDIFFWGVDQPHAIDLCKKHHSFGQWLGVDFENDPELPSTKIDLAITSDVIEHLENPDSLLNYCRAILAPGGYLLLSTPERDILRGPACRHSPNPYHIREWNGEELCHYLESRGFKVLEHKNLPALRFGINGFYMKKVLSRWMYGKTIRYNQAVLLQSEI